MSLTAPRITVYRTSRCPFCVAAEQFLRRKNARFEQVLLDDHPDRWGFVSDLKPGHYTVPLIVIGDEPIGGFDDLMRLEQDGRLDALLAGD